MRLVDWLIELCVLWVIAGAIAAEHVLMRSPRAFDSPAKRALLVGGYGLSLVVGLLCGIALVIGMLRYAMIIPATVSLPFDL
jgi:uncharacterized membrane protein